MIRKNGGRPRTGADVHLRSSEKIIVYSAIGGGAFIAALCVLLLMLIQCDTLVRLGLVGNVYYFLLVPLGLSVAVFLFGVLRSHATYVNKCKGKSLELGGPIVAFILVVVLGFYLVPNPEPLTLTLFVHGAEGQQDVPLRNTGWILLDLGGDRRREPIGDKGQSVFAGIPATFRGQSVPVALDAPGHELTVPNRKITIEDGTAYVELQPRAAELTGYVRSDTAQPIAGAKVSVDGTSAQTDVSGFFRLTVPRAGPRQNLSMEVAATGFSGWTSRVVPGGGEIVIVLDRAHRIVIN